MTPVLLGRFRVDQKRKRQLYTHGFSHVAVAFDVGLLLVETSRVRDYAVAAATRIPSPIPHGALGLRLVRSVPTYRRAEQIIDDLESVTPETLASAFPGRTRRVWTTQITDAVLRRTRPAQLHIAFNSERHGNDTKLRLSISWTQELDAVRGPMQQMLGDRYSETRGGVREQIGLSGPVLKDWAGLGHDAVDALDWRPPHR
jgi:hypothetical protein